MHFNYRIVQYGGEYGDYFGLQEVQYREDGGIMGFSDKAAVVGLTIECIREAVAQMQMALELPVIDMREETDNGN